MLEKLFGSKTRVLVLRLFLNNPDKYFFVRELARSLNVHLNALRRELDNLGSLGILLSTNRPEGRKDAVETEEDSGKRKYYYLNRDCPLIDDLRALFIKAHTVMEHTLAEKVAKLGEIDFFLLSGVFVGSEEAEADILIVGSIAKHKVQRLIVKFEKEMSRSLNYALMTKSEFNYRRSVADKFLVGLLENKNITLINRLREKL